MNRPTADVLRIPLIEDSRSEAVYVERTLTRGGPEAGKVVKAYTVAMAALARRLGKVVPSPLFGRPESTQLVWVISRRRPFHKNLYKLLAISRKNTTPAKIREKLT